jgi:RNA polymerase sigma-70 factor, ECF subfamily
MTAQALDLNTLATQAAQTAQAIINTSFEDLYKQHYRRVFSLCLKMTANVAEAEDLAHDVFLQVQRKLSSFRGESAFTTWLHRITVNQVLMHFRKKSVRSELTTETGEVPEKIDIFSIRSQNSPIIDQIALTAAIAKLPTGYRTVFTLHDMQGYEHEEIAKILGISAGTSKSQLHKARMRLRTLLTNRVKSEAEEAAEANIT